MMDLALGPLSPQPVSASDQAFQALYDAVISLKLPPGTKVSEAEVAKQLDVSRQPVRDAFFRLSNLGFLSIRPQRATLITKISQRAVLDAVFTRTALEVECLRVTIDNADPGAVTALRDNIDRQRNAISSGDRRQFHALDEAFHETLCDLAGHHHAWALILDQKAHMDRIRYLTLSEDRQQKAMDEHSALVDAIDAQDAAQAEITLRAHLSDIRTILGRVEAQYPDYFESTGK